MNGITQITFPATADSWPAISNDGTIYASGYGKFHAFTSTGTEKWSWKFIDDGSDSGSRFSSPGIGNDGNIYVETNTQYWQTNWGSSYDLSALTPNGTYLWTFGLESNISGWSEKFSSLPSIGIDGTIYVGSLGGKLYAINPNGIKKWSYSIGAEINSSPAIGSDGTIYVGSDNGAVNAIDPNYGTLISSYTTGGAVQSSPAIGSDGTIYVGSNDNKLYAINPNGSLKWYYPTGGPVQSSPAIGSDGIIYVGSNDYSLYAINPNGSLKWSYATSGPVRSSPSIGSDGTIYVGSDDGNLYAIVGSGHLANTVWPKFRHDLQNTGKK